MRGELSSPSEVVESVQVERLCNKLHSAPLDPFCLLQEKVSTCVGTVTVGVVGDRKKPGIITFHDLGLNGEPER